MRLLEYARQFEEDGFRGLFRFVAMLRRMMERGDEPELPGEGGDSVSIMSIHKSKGLEFPVVFLCDTARRFNRQDAALRAWPRCEIHRHKARHRVPDARPPRHCRKDE